MSFCVPHCTLRVYPAISLIDVYLALTAAVDSHAGSVDVTVVGLSISVLKHFRRCTCVTHKAMQHLPIVHVCVVEQGVMEAHYCLTINWFP